MKLFGRKNKKPSESDLLGAALLALNEKNYPAAIELYLRIISEYPKCVDAYYNMGVLTATGKGLPVNYVEAARWFYQAELLGDPEGEKLVTKTINDYIRLLLSKVQDDRLFYEGMIDAAKYVYEKNYTQKKVNSQICWFARYQVDEKNYDISARLFRIGAELGNHGLSQNFLAASYNQGLGVPQNDLIALYWFDKAVQNGAEEAKRDRFGIFNGYRNVLSPEEFTEYMHRLALWCETGTAHIPKDPERAQFWKKSATI